MNWQDQLQDIVDHEHSVPTFAQWLQRGGYARIPPDVSGPIQMHSVIRALYLQYQREYRRAA